MEIFVSSNASNMTQDRMGGKLYAIASSKYFDDVLTARGQVEVAQIC
jgi:hypothetical protein